MPNEITLAQLTELLRDSAGADESVDLDGDILDKTWIELKYDSLAVLQITGRIEREHRIEVNEDAASLAQTPREFLAVVNEAFANAEAESA